MPDPDDFSDLSITSPSGSSDAAAMDSLSEQNTQAVQAQQIGTTPGAEAKLPSDSYWDQLAGARTAVLRASLRVASQQSPDAAATATAVARQTGIPEDIAARNPAEARGVAVAQQADQLADKHPELSQWLSNPRNAAVAHDDLPTLTTIDHTVRAIQAGRNGDLTGILPPGYIFDRDGTILQPLPGGLATVYQDLSELSTHLREVGEANLAADVDHQQTIQRMGNPLYLGRIGRLLEQGLVAAQQSRGIRNPDAESSIGSLNEAYPQEADSLATRLAQMGGGIAGQGPELMIGGELAPIAEAIFDASKAKSLISAGMGARAAEWASQGVKTAAVMAPMNVTKALDRAKEEGIGAGLTDFIATSGIVAATGPVGAARLLTPFAKASVSRGTTPVIQAILKDAGLMGTQNAALAVSQALEDRVFGDKQIDPEQLLHSIIANGELGAVAGGLFALGPAFGDRAHREATAAAGSLESADHIKMALAQIRDSKLNGRSPADMKAVLDSSLGASDHDRNVYLQSADWQEHWNAQDADPVAKAQQAGALDQFREAQATGGTMALPLSSYLQTLSDSKNGEALIAKTRMSPGAMTPEEAARWHQTTPDEMEKIYRQGAEQASALDAEAAQSPATEEIYQDVKTQIAAARPHWPEATLDAVSRIYSRTLGGIARFASPEGAEPMDPRDLHQRISIGSELPESLRTKGFDSIKALMDRITSGDGAASPEEESAMSDLSAHVEAMGGAIGDHALANIQGMMRNEAERILGNGTQPNADAPAQAAAANNQAVGDRLRERLGQDDAAQAYNGIPGTEGGKILNVDLARELSPEYAASNEARATLSAATHQAASEFIKNEFKRRLVEHAGEPVLFLAGGGGSGKGVATRGPLSDTIKRSGVVVDGVMGKLDSARNQIMAAKSVGSPITVAYVHRPFNEALAGVIERAEREGRSVPLDVLAQAHAGSNETIASLAKEFGNDPQVSFRVFDNSGNKLREIPIAEIGTIRHAHDKESVNAVAERLRNGVTDEQRTKLDPAGTLREPDAGRSGLHGEGYGRRSGDAGDQEQSGQQGPNGGAAANGLSPKDVEEASLVDDANGKKYEQPSRGGYSPLGDGRSQITLGPGADPSTVIHELGHYALDTLAEMAARDNVPAQLTRDMQTLYNHIGIKDQAAWDAMDFEQRRDAHEKFAQSFESYFMEGKAPTPELRGVFRKIRNLMVAIYRTLKPLVSLSPEARNVFDRLLDADTEMAKASEEIASKPIFRSAEEAGMGTDEFAAYLRDAAAEHEQDRARLMDRTMRDVQRRLTDNWKSEEATVHGDMENLVNGRPEFKAMLALQSGKWPEGLKPEGSEAPLKLDRAEIVQRYGDDALKALPGRSGFSNNPNRGSPLYAKEGGIGMDAAASLLGFRSADEMWQALTQSGNRSMEVDKLTRKEMDRRHPDPVEDGTMSDDAMHVLHGASQAKRIMAELDSLARPVGQAPPPMEVLRQVAERKIADRDVRSINPEIYRRAEAKASREVMEALARQDRVGAYQAQVRRALSSEMYKAASDAKKTIQDGLDFAKKFNDNRVREILGKAGGWEWQVFDLSGKPFMDEHGNVRTFTSDTEASKFSKLNDNAPYLRTSSYLGQIDAIRQRFGFTNGRPAGYVETLESFIRDQVERGSEVMIPDWVAQTADRMPWKDLSYGQFRDVIDTIENFEHLGREANKLSQEMGKAILSEKVYALTSVSDANKQRIRKRSTAPGLVDKVSDMAAGWDAMLTRLSTQIHIMDGFKDGGEWWDTFVRPLQECANKEAKMQAADAEELRALADAAGYNDQTGWVYRREFIPEIDDHLSHMSRMTIAAYYGRQEGRERLLTSHWTQDQIQRLVLDKLTAKDRDFLHGVWRMFDRKFPDLRALEQRLTGVTVEQSRAMPFTNSAGIEFKGGYIPIKYDPRANPKAEALVEAANATEVKRGAFGRAKTRDSMVKKTQQTTGMKLRLDEGVIFSGLGETNHRLSHQEALTDLSKIMTHKGMADTIARNHGIDAYNLIRDTLTDVAGGTKENLGVLGKWMHHIRTGVPAAAFGFNAMRAFLDIAESLPQAVARISPVHLVTATGKMLGSAARFESFAKGIAAKSEVMADRQRTDLRMAADAFKGARVGGKVRATFDHLAQSVMHQAHLFTDHIVWQGAYDQALAQGHAEAKAIALADSITQDAQSSARTMDLAKFQRGSEFHKMLTVAYGFFGSVYQIQKVAGQRGLSQIRQGNVVGGAARMFRDYVCLYSLPIAIDMALKSYLRSGPNDKPKEGGEIAWDMAKEHLAFALGTMPVARELGGALTGHMGYSGPAGERGVTALYGVMQGLIHDVDHAVEGKESPHHSGMSQTERNTVMAAGIFFHLPAVQVQRSVDGIAYAMEHGQNPLLPALVGKPPKK